MRALRVLGYVAAGIGGLALLGAGGIYAKSELVVRERIVVEAPPFTVPLPTDSASLAEGARIALTRGCAGCHGEGVKGRVFFSESGVAHLPAPNLTALVRQRTDAELERAIRHGVKPDGTVLFSMPAEMYRSLTDEDLARLLAWIRSLPEAEGETSTRRLGPLGRVGVALGQFRSSVYYVQTETPLAPPADSALRLGHYVAISSCTECHTNTMQGDGQGSPSIPAVLAAYTQEEFAEMLRTGLAKGGREMRMMSGVARGRLSHLTPAEVESLYAYFGYLRSAASTPATQ
jgi:cytochrome c553